jgi:predicted nucleotide-binding protein (sugar kinase/HSP70/actin superfamily)
VLALSNKDSLRSIEESELGELEVGITQRVFCVMSYYPFFSFYE